MARSFVGLHGSPQWGVNEPEQAWAKTSGSGSRIEGVRSAHVHVWASVIIRRWVTPSKVCRRILLLTSVRACRLGTGQRQEADSDVGEGNVPWPCRWSSVPCAR